jgi:hypothetical protein
VIPAVEGGEIGAAGGVDGALAHAIPPGTLAEPRGCELLTKDAAGSKSAVQRGAAGIVAIRTRPGTPPRLPQRGRGPNRS